MENLCSPLRFSVLCYSLSQSCDATIDARNAIARAFIEAEKIPADDQHALITPHPELYEDAFHFNKAGSAMMGVQAAAIIRRVLEHSEH